MRCVFSFILFCQSYFLSAQVQLLVKVMDAEGQELPGATVLLNNKHGAVANANAYAVFPDLKKGDYHLKVSFVGYDNHEENLNLQEKRVLQVVLKSKNILTEEVMVSGVRANAKMPITYYNVGKEEIERKNLGQDIPYLLQGTPSLVAVSDAGAGVGYTGFRIRGTDANRINVTINGVPLNDSESHGVFWVNMPDMASSVEDIQIQRGVGTSTNGSGAFGASVNLQTSGHAEKPYVETNLGWGSFDTRKQTFKVGTGLLKSKVAFDARLSAIQSDGFVDRATSDLKSFYLSGGYFGTKDLIKLIVFSGKEKTYQAWSGVPSSMLSTNRTHNGEGEYVDDNGNVQYYDNQVDDYKQTHFQLLYATKLTEQLTWNTALHYTKGQGFYESYKGGRKFSDYGLNAPQIGTNSEIPDKYLDGTSLKKTDLVQQKWLDNDFYGLTTSFEYKNRALSILGGGAWNTYKGDHFGEVIWSKYGFFPSRFRWYFNQGEKTDYNLYTKATYELVKGFNLFGDLQFRRISHKIEGVDDDLRNITQTHTFNFFNPKFGLSCNLNSHTTAYFSWARAGREPNRSNFTDANSTEGVPKKEILDDFELGVRYRKPKAFLEANTYFMNYDNQLIHTGAINDVGSAIMTNVKDSYRLGLELSGSYLLSKSLSCSANMTISRNKAKNFVAYVDDWDTGVQRVENLRKTDLSFSPDLIANSRIQWTPFSDFRINLASSFVDKQYVDNTQSDSRMLKAYWVNNLEVSYEWNAKWADKIKLHLHVNNLFDQKYEANAWVYRYYQNDKEEELNGYFPQAGINIMAGISLKF